MKAPVPKHSPSRLPAPLACRRTALVALLVLFILLARHGDHNFHHYTTPPFCASGKQPVVRQEWRQLGPWARRAFLTSVACLQQQPSRLAPGVVPASRSLYDDFVAVHINMTVHVHFSAIFLSWHRHFLYLFEKALHEHCNLPPSLGVPYWNWALDATHGLSASPLFQASPISFGTSDTESGCVTTGAFAGTAIAFNRLDVLASLDPATGIPRPLPWPAWTLAPAPLMCLYREPKDALARVYFAQARLDAAMRQTSPDEFQARVAGWHPAAEEDDDASGLHGAAHNIVGGVMSDAFVAPADPVFWPVHAMLDRVWAVWQAGERDGDRRLVFTSNASRYNMPGAAEVDADTLLRFGVLRDDVRLRDVADPLAGEYCYVYT